MGVAPLVIYQRAIKAGFTILVRDGRVGWKGPADEHPEIVREIRLKRDLLVDLFTCERHAEVRQPMKFNPGLLRCPACIEEWGHFRNENTDIINEMEDS